MAHGSANLNLMIKAARKAGQSLLRDFGEVEKLQASMKSPGDFVSKADIRAEQILHRDLTEARPTYGWLGEETGATAGADPTRRWIVDPLDGTTNFLHGIPHWAVSVALEHKGEIVAAVVHDPVKNELYWAEKGEGAWINDSRARVSGRRKPIEMVYATGLPFAGRSDLPETLKDLGHVLPTCAGVRRMGAASLDLAYVAVGRFDGFWERRLNAWDTAAGILLVREAGGLVESIRRAGKIFEDKDVLAAPGETFDAFARMIRGSA